VALQSPEVLLENLNNALRHLRGACTDLDDEDIDKKLLAVMRRLLLAEVLGSTWIVAIGGSQGAGKTTLITCMYGLRGEGPQWLEGNEGRGEKMPVLVLEQNDIQQAQGYVRRLVPDRTTTNLILEDIQVDVAEFQRAVCDPAIGDLLPVLRVPRRYFKRNDQAWLLLPGYEKQDRDNRAWQELMRQAMIAAGGCIVVTDGTRMANQQQNEIIKDMLTGELEGVQPYIVISKTEDTIHNPTAQAQLRASAQSMFQVPPEAAEKHIILTGTDDPEYVAQWMPHLQRAINDLNFTGRANRHMQMSDLSDLVGKDLMRVLNLIRSKSRLYFESESVGDGMQALQSVLEKFDDAAEALRNQHAEVVSGLVNQAYIKAAKRLDITMAKEHEGFKNWIFSVFDTTSETKTKLQNLVQVAWQDEAAQLFSNYSNELCKLTAPKLGRIDAASVTSAKPCIDSEKSQSLIRAGYMHESGQLVHFQNLTPEKVSDIRMLLGHNTQEEAHAHRAASKSLGISVELVPAVSLEYTRLFYVIPEAVGLEEGVVPAADTPASNAVQNGVQSLQAGVDLGKTALRSLATVMAVDVVSDGDSDILGAIFGSKKAPSETSVSVVSTTENSDGAATAGVTESPDSTALPTVPMTLHPAAVAATAVVAAAYLTTVAVSRIRTFEKAVSAQAFAMLGSVHDHHVDHLRKQFDKTMAAARARIVEGMRARYRMDEKLMRKDRLARTMADVLSLTSDLRHELGASAAGLNVFVAERSV